jgi:DNA-binding SARP family transcriptional activator/tetratricopeptide (TPR) repeat protein
VSLGELLRTHRVRLGLSQDELARRSGLSVRALRDMEQDRVRRPRAQSVHRLAGALDLSEPARARLLAALGPDHGPVADTVRIQVLGPLAVSYGGAPVEMSPTGRALLGLFGVQPRGVVSHDEIVDTLWGDRPPRTCRSLVHVYVRQLRSVLEPQRARRAPARTVTLVPGGYRLDLSGDQLDVAAFDDLVWRAGTAQSAGDRGPAEAMLAQALRMWRGPVLLDGGPWVRHHPAVVALGQRRLAATLAYADLAQDARRPEEAVARLRALAPEQPLHEGLHARLMLALAGTGDQAAALQIFSTVRQRLADELGIEPGPELADAQVRVLRQHTGPGPVQTLPAREPAPVPPARARLSVARLSVAASTATGTDIGVPAQLPPNVPAFTGRESLLRELEAIVAQADGRSTVISAIVGTAGVGKTALAVQWAHQIRNQFVDGQLYVNLRGFSSGPALRPIDALVGFLHALGVASEDVPAGVEEASALYRSLVADRRMLILLDNANHPDQVRPLLPGGPGCHVVITSRDRLAGLVARDGARSLSLDVLTANESHVLIGRLIGVGRVLGELEATADLARLCARLPLALRIAAANLASQPRHTVTSYTAQLREGNRLAALVVDGDEETAVRAAFDLSYAALPGPARRMFRLLGAAPGPDTTAEAAAALADIETTEAARLVEQLASANLIDPHAPGRYGFHDLMRLYALERSTVEDEAMARRDALARVFEYYLHRGHAAARRISEGVLRLPLPPTARPAAEFRDNASAFAWLDAERVNLLAAIDNAAADGPRQYAWRIADALRGYFLLRMFTVDWLTAANAALSAAEAEDDLFGKAAARLSLGVLSSRQFRHDDAIANHLACARDGAAAGWSDAVAAAAGNLGGVYLEQGRLPESANQLREAVQISRACGSVGPTASALANLGHVSTYLGHLEESAAQLTEAVGLCRELGYHVAGVWANLGEACYLLGRLDTALSHLTASLGMHREAGNRAGEANALRSMSHVLREAGRLSEAMTVAERAVRTATEAGHRPAEAVAHGALGWAKASLGNHRGAVDDHERALRLARTTGHLCPEVEALIGMADARRHLGELAAAQTYATSGLGIARDAGFRVHEGQAMLILAEIQLDLGQDRLATEQAGRALVLHQDTGHRLGEARAYLLLGRLRQVTDARAAAEHTRAAEELFRSAGAPVPATAPV